MGFILFLAVLAAMFTSVVYTMDILNKTKPLWVALAYGVWVVILFVGGIAYTDTPERGWVLFTAWAGIAATGPIIAPKEWAALAKVLGGQWYVKLFSKKVEINGKVHLVPPYVTSLHIKQVHSSSYRYDIMFNDEVIIKDIVLFEETIATFPRSL